MPFQKTKRSPLPNVRRLAGQSLREEWDRRVNDNLPFIIFVPLMFWLVWCIQWSELAQKNPPHPRLWLALAVIATGAASIAFLRVRSHCQRLLRGERGELKVAEALDELRALGYRPIHDLQRKGFNIDHVVVGPGGVFVVETKFRSGHGEIEFRNGEGLFIGGFQDERDCLTQARGNAREVNKLIRENCRMDKWVTPLVVFVGDWKIKDQWQTTDARVFTPDRLIGYIRDQQPLLTRSEIKLIETHLACAAKS